MTKKAGWLDQVDSHSLT